MSFGEVVWQAESVEEMRGLTRGVRSFVRVIKDEQSEEVAG